MGEPLVQPDIWTLIDLANELIRAREKFPNFNSPHEGYAIIKEELDELWEEVRLQHKDRSPERMYKEAIQVAAMGIRFATDLCSPKLAKDD